MSPQPVHDGDQPPLRFIVRSIDGRVLDAFWDTDLATYDPGRPGRCWQEAALWAHLATVADRRRRVGEGTG